MVGVVLMNSCDTCLFPCSCDARKCALLRALHALCSVIVVLQL